MGLKQALGYFLHTTIGEIFQFVLYIAFLNIKGHDFKKSKKFKNSYFFLNLIKNLLIDFA